MGKYMKKPKIAGIAGDVAVMEVSSQSSLGVRTRAKTLALQRLQKSQSPSFSSADPDASSFSYLQLRSRRLEKVLVDIKKQQQSSEQPKRGFRESPNGNCCSVNRGVKEGSGKLVLKKEEVSFEEFAKGIQEEEKIDVDIEPSFGENVLESESRDWLEKMSELIYAAVTDSSLTRFVLAIPKSSASLSTRESTPCSLIGDSNVIGSPGSSTRQRTSPMTNHINYEEMHRIIPTAYEMEEFFAYAEKQQQSIFMEKYNFDIVNDVPLPGRYEWVQVLH